jgi:hypothetical protein
MPYVCRVCGLQFAMRASEGAFESHVRRCVDRNQGFIDACRPAGVPYEGDPELAAFARAEGDVYNRRPGTRRRPL